jgi:uncharacterized Fe-S cluster protein YjdI
MSKEHTYSNGEIDIVGKPDSCIHSKKCWVGLRAVFQPGERPWIRADAASTAAIKAQIDQCPSGALSYRDRKATEPSPSAVPATMEVELTPNGPLMVKSPCVVKHSDGREEVRERTTAFCRCGASANKPYCDGAHRRIGFTDQA